MLLLWRIVGRRSGFRFGFGFLLFADLRLDGVEGQSGGGFGGGDLFAEGDCKSLEMVISGGCSFWGFKTEQRRRRIKEEREEEENEVLRASSEPIGTASSTPRCSHRNFSLPGVFLLSRLSLGINNSH